MNLVAIYAFTRAFKLAQMAEKPKTQVIRNIDRLTIAKPRGFGTVQIRSLSPAAVYTAALDVGTDVSVK